MLSSASPSSRDVGHAQRFATTRWSIVLAAGQDVSQESRGAMQSLCQSYWFPVYAYVRRHASIAEDAQDLTQGFFAHLLGHDAIGKLRKGLDCVARFFERWWVLTVPLKVNPSAKDRRRNNCRDLKT